MNWETSQHDLKLIQKIVVRACSMLNLESKGSSRLDLAMDLTACHVNGCPLQLEQLLVADKFDFVHDVAGIMRHIDRKTGALGDCFLPRYAVIEDSSSVASTPGEGADSQ